METIIIVNIYALKINQLRKTNDLVSSMLKNIVLIKKNQQYATAVFWLICLTYDQGACFCNNRLVWWNSSSCVLGKLVSVASQFPNVRNVAGNSSWCKRSEVTMLPSYQHGGLM